MRDQGARREGCARRWLGGAMTAPPVTIQGDTGWVASGEIRVGHASGYLTFEASDGQQALFRDHEIPNVLACLRELGVLP